MITSGSPTEQFEICVSGAYFRGIWIPGCEGHVTDRHSTYSTPVTCGVVRGMSVTRTLGTDYTDVHVPNICGPKGYIRLRNGCRVFILRRGKTVSYAKSDEPKAGAASAADTKVRPAHKVVFPPRSRGYVPVQTSLQGNGVITQRHRVYERHRVHVATGTMDCTANQTWWVELTHTGTTSMRFEVTHTGNTSKRLPKGMVMGHLSAYSGTVAVISREDWAALSPSPTTAPDATDFADEPDVHTLTVPEEFRPQMLAQLEKHGALWSGHLCSIKATKHRIELKPGLKPVRLNPYRMGPQTRKLVKDQVDRMPKLEVIEPSQSGWASPVVLIRKPDKSLQFLLRLMAVERAYSTPLVSITPDGRLPRLLRGCQVLLHVLLQRGVLADPPSQGEQAYEGIYLPLWDVPVYAAAVWHVQCHLPLSSGLLT